MQDLRFLWHFNLYEGETNHVFTCALMG